MNEIVHGSPVTPSPGAAPVGHGATRAADGVPRLAWTLAEFERLAELGFFGGPPGARERVELIDGEIVPMAAKGARHEWVRGELDDRFGRLLPRDLRCYPELGWRPGGDRYLEPDLLIGAAGHEPAFVPPAAVLLALEIGDSSLDYDRSLKARIYATIGVREFWSIDAVRLVTRVFTTPTADAGYAHARDVGPAERLVPTLAPVLAVTLADLGILPTV
jgi:Uma2 family endonuclease